MFGALGNFASLMKQAGQMRAKMEVLQDEMKQRRVIGSAGGGLVEVEMNGLQEVVACRIDPRFPSQTERERLQQLVGDAVNDALARSKQLHAEALKSMAGGLDVPGLEAAFGKLTGG